MRYAEHNTGFDWGAADVRRLMSDQRKGWVILGIKTPRTDLQVYVTPTSKVRVFTANGRRVMAYSRTWIDAVNRAIEKMRTKEAPKLALVKA